MLCCICIYMIPTLNKNSLTLLYYFSATSGQTEFKTCFNRIGVAQFSVFSALSTIVCLFVLFSPVYCRSTFGLKCDGNYSEKSTFPHLFLTKENYYYIWTFWVLCRLSHISGSTYRIKTKDLMPLTTRTPRSGKSFNY